MRLDLVSFGRASCSKANVAIPYLCWAISGRFHLGQDSFDSLSRPCVISLRSTLLNPAFPWEDKNDVKVGFQIKVVNVTSRGAPKEGY